MNPEIKQAIDNLQRVLMANGLRYHESAYIAFENMCEVVTDTYK